MRTNSPIKICYVVDTIEGPNAGTEKQILLLINNLDQSKFKPYLCVLHSSNWLRKNLSSCVIYEIGMTSLKNLQGWKAVFKFSKFLRKEKIDIVQTYFPDGSIVGILAAKLAGIPVTIGNRRSQGYSMNGFDFIIQKLLNRVTNLFFTNCEDTKKWMEKTEGIDPQRICVIYNGIDMNKFEKSSEKQRQDFRKLLGFKTDTLLVGLVANLRDVKAIDVFINAAKIVLIKLPQLRFVIIGEGPDRDKLEALCGVLGIESSIRFLGKRLDVPEILTCIDIGVLSSNTESFSNAIIEYMAAGLAVVCTNVGGAREAVDDGVNGFVVEPGDYCTMAERISAIIEKNSFAEMGRRGREKAVKLYSQEEIVARYQRLYEGIA